jgi:hypothetical protein
LSEGQETSKNKPRESAESGVTRMEQKLKHCAGMESQLADVLLDPERASAKVLSHLKECEGCSREVEELKATMALLEGWQAPEPSPYFLSRLGASLREEREQEPAGWLGRQMAGLRARFAYGTAPHLRPMVAAALTIVVLLGGGAYLGITEWNPKPPPAGQAVVRDLQTLANNADLLDQMETLSSNDGGDTLQQ